MKCDSTLPVLYIISGQTYPYTKLIHKSIHKTNIHLLSTFGPLVVEVPSIFSNSGATWVPMAGAGSDLEVTLTAAVYKRYNPLV